MQWIPKNLAMPSHSKKCGRRDQLHDEGQPTPFWVKHCGHPTANYPWYVEEHTDTEILFHGTHSHIGDAKETAERMYTGELVRVGDYLLTPTEAENE